METIVHLWNVSTFFEKKHNQEVAKLRMHYSRCCRELSDRIELPKEKFGTAVLCPECGSSWASTKHKTRIASGKKPSRRMDKLVRRSSDNLKLSKYHRTLIRKYNINRANKVIKRCLVCSGVDKSVLSKPQRQKIAISSNLLKNLNSTVSSKKLKKHAKDRTAGLTVSTGKTLGAHSQMIIPLQGNKKDNVRTLKTQKTVSKPKIINLPKLKGMITTTSSLSTKSKLRTFLEVFR